MSNPRDGEDQRPASPSQKKKPRRPPRSRQPRNEPAPLTPRRGSLTSHETGMSHSLGKQQRTGPGDRAGQNRSAGGRGRARRRPQSPEQRRTEELHRHRSQENEQHRQRDRQRRFDQTVESMRGQPDAAREAPPAAASTQPGAAAGVLEVLPKGFGFLRNPEASFQGSSEDPYVGADVIARLRLRPGMKIEAKTEGNRVSEVVSINCQPPEAVAGWKDFQTLVSIDPIEKFDLATGDSDPSMRVVDLITPVGKGQRGLIVAPPKTGKTTLVEQLAHAIAQNHPEVKLVMLLIDERPEEVTHMKRTVRGQVLASSADQLGATHLQVAKLALEMSRRMVEAGDDVVLLLDSLTRLGRASNRETSSRNSRTLSGGLDAQAMEFPRKFFGSARKIEGGGSLTILASALIDTGSLMDEVIFQEFKGTGNMELVLDRKLSDRRIFPAVNILESGTRKEEKLFSKEDLPGVHKLRRVLANLKEVQAMELLLKGIAQTSSNRELLEKIDKIL